MKTKYKPVNLAKFARLWNDGKSQNAIMTAMGWEPAEDADPNKRIRATKSFIKTKLNNKVKDEKTGEIIKLKDREREPRSAVNGKAKVAKAAKVAKVAKANVVKTIKAKGRKPVTGDRTLFVTATKIGLDRSPDGQMLKFKVRGLPAVVVNFDLVPAIKDRLTELENQPIEAETVAEPEVETEGLPESPEGTQEGTQEETHEGLPESQEAEPQQPAA